MSMIVDANILPTKKSLKEAVCKDPDGITFYDPAIMPEWRKYGIEFQLNHLEMEDEIIVTNSKRTWFASIKRTPKGYKVS